MADMRPRLALKAVRSARLAAVDLALAPGECAAVMGPRARQVLCCVRSPTWTRRGRSRTRRRAAFGHGGYEWRRQVIYCQAEAGWWEERVAAHFDDAPPPSAAAFGHGGYEWRRQVIYCQAEGWWEERVAAHLTTLPPPSGWWSWGWRPKMQALVRELSHRRTPAPGPGARLGETARACWDEPTAALDPDATARRTEVRRYLDEGGAALLVTHSEEQARRLCRRAWRMRQGKLETLWT